MSLFYRSILPIPLHIYEQHLAGADGQQSEQAQLFFLEPLKSSIAKLAFLLTSIMVTARDN
jgi:hypothetical protein